MSFDVRSDPLTRQTVIITGSRQRRPNLPSSGCPFCVGGTEAPDPYDVRWFVNRWPAIPDGRAEVILYSPEHEATFASLGVANAGKVIDLWAQRTTELASRDDVAYVLVFENRGPEVGATIAHPHGQVYAFDDVPEAARRELTGPDCVLCGRAAGEGQLGLEVTRHLGWSAVVPSAATWPYELLLAPDGHIPDLADPAAERPALAALLVDVLDRLDRLFSAPMPYMLWVHQQPTDGGNWPMAHVHVHIAPLLRAPGTPRYVAAGELGSGVFFNPLAPEQAAAELRDLGPS